MVESRARVSRHPGAPPGPTATRMGVLHEHSYARIVAVPCVISVAFQVEACTTLARHMSFVMQHNLEHILFHYAVCTCEDTLHIPCHEAVARKHCGSVCDS